MNIFFKFKRKVSKQINPNLGGLFKGSFLPFAPTRLQVWKPYLHLNSHTYLASCICDFFDQSLF